MLLPSRATNWNFIQGTFLGGEGTNRLCTAPVEGGLTGRPKMPECARSSLGEVDTFTWFPLFSLKSTTEKRIGGAITTSQLWVK